MESIFLFLEPSRHCKECVWCQPARAGSDSRPLAGVVDGMQKGRAVPLIAYRSPPKGFLLLRLSQAGIGDNSQLQ